ncbi:PIN domain-containing protein [Myxosarcina sp. GI1]|uniref:PIN domain-containing protein n=1 Tax=Myxosarcina sp. GI1 TaxID=1541065 RepID=UPI00155AD402|nr:type II toxin-antitoxin system VapC family toxin [Myxosarcina sp. GI1]
MIGLDTNVVVRYLTKDDVAQWQKATEVIELAESCFICNIVLCEVVWVLKGKPYNYSQLEIVKTIELMLQSPKFDFEDKSLVYQAISDTKQGNADFADYLIGAIDNKNNCQYTVTFDRKLNKVKRFNLLE